ncbi:MAG TPA: 16S rRNA (guanine(527)-N(7))-methyltransferase RsmG, partial [Steroidobacteraceae bacterium]|nr:16S rRNA (guanine(527)-N(7))-methyltransferase RsmG [Steroidobacteraceae bacterium]
MDSARIVAFPSEPLISGAEELGVPLDGAAASRLLVLLDALDEWNARMNLTAIRDRSQQITKHLLDSLSAHVFLRGERIADVGTGAGFPGLPLALVNPAKQFTLLDATAKKLDFVGHMAGTLGLDNVVTVHDRVESWRPAAPFDVVLTRAFGPLERIVEWCGHLIDGTGRLLLMKGRLPADELERLPP